MSLCVSHISSYREAPGRVTRGVGHGCDSEALWGCPLGKPVGVLVALATVGRRKWSKAPETGETGRIQGDMSEGSDAPSEGVSTVPAMPSPAGIL